MSTHRSGRTRGTVLLTLLLATCAPVHAEYSPSGSFLRATYALAQPEAFGSGLGQRIRTREYDLLAGFGNVALGAGTFSAGLDYRYTRYEFEALQSRDWDLHWLRVPVNWRRTSDNRTVIATIAPGIASSSNRFKDPGEYANDDLDVAAHFAVVQRSSPTLSWTAGLSFDRRFGRPMLYPTGGAIVRASERWTLWLIAPDPEIAFTQNARLRWFAFLAPAGHRWHAFNEAAARRFDFETRAWRATAGGELRLLNSLSMQIFAGREFGRHYEFLDDTGRRVDEDAAAANFAGLRFAVPAFGSGDSR